MRNQPIYQSSYQPDFALHTLGWKAFQDLCAQICAESIGRTVSIYREAQDGGQDAVFLLPADQNYCEATVQCKFSSKPDQRLKLGDITSELQIVETLVRDGRASTYYFITSMGVDAPVAAKIRTILKSKGVEQPLVLGREWLTTEIRSSARLRALVPRVYGLGDLSSILDERVITQTHALLGHLLPSLQVYVPTAAHRSAVRILGDHKLVLLLGAPAIGKSMLAAILATMAVDTDNLDCIKCDGPLELGRHWNPNEQNRLFWVDDAFGPNQLREDYVDAWIEFMPKMKTAIDQGCHFILTSRTHIWNEAKLRLGTRNHQLFVNEKAVVRVGQLSPEERQQILYNHIKGGQQKESWKSLIKPHLSVVAEEPNLLPEIARRLGDPHYTSAIRKLPEDLIRFIKSPQDFLKGTIQELGIPQQAAMTLVFLSRSRLSLILGNEIQLVADKYATSVASIAQALEQLNGSFIVQREERGVRYWTFIHPTFADAISSILSGRPDLVDLYLRGVKIDTLLAEVVCEGASQINDAVLIPASSFDELIARLLETPNEANNNEKLFQFLNRRIPLEILKRLLQLDFHLLNRKGSQNYWTGISRSAEILLKAKAHSLGLLNEDIRQEICDELEDAARVHLDVSFLSNESILAIFRPYELIKTFLKIISMLEETIPAKILETEGDADPDADIDDQFEPITSFLEEVQSLSEYDRRIKSRLDELSEEVSIAKERVELFRSDDDEQSTFKRVPLANMMNESNSNSVRSIFSDIDQ